jgi:hypothetical protein
MSHRPSSFCGGAGVMARRKKKKKKKRGKNKGQHSETSRKAFSRIPEKRVLKESKDAIIDSRDLLSSHRSGTGFWHHAPGSNSVAFSFTRSDFHISFCSRLCACGP